MFCPPVRTAIPQASVRGLLTILADEPGSISLVVSYPVHTLHFLRVSRAII